MSFDSGSRAEGRCTRERKADMHGSAAIGPRGWQATGFPGDLRVLEGLGIAKPFCVGAGRWFTRRLRFSIPVITRRRNSSSVTFKVDDTLKQAGSLGRARHSFRVAAAGEKTIDKKARPFQEDEKIPPRRGLALPKRSPNPRTCPCDSTGDSFLPS